MLRTTCLGPALLVSFATALHAQGVVLGPDLLAPLGRAGDVDGDGVDDYTLGGTGFTVHSGATGTAIPFLASATADAIVAVGDADADGHGDLAYVTGLEVTIVSGRDGATLHSWTFPSAPRVDGGDDFDADGCADVVIGYVDGAERALEVRSGRTGLVLFDTTSTAALHGEAIGDFDGDGYADLAVFTTDTVASTWTADVLRGPGLTLFATLDGNPAFLRDIDGNGTTDYTRHVAATPPETEIRAGGTQAVIVVWPWDPEFRALGDVDGDGRADFLVHEGAYQEMYSGGILHLLLPSINMSVLGIQAVPLGDIDGDGRAETHVPGTGQLVEWDGTAVPFASRMVTRGLSGTTSLGHRPKLIARGHCKLGDEIRWDLRAGTPNGVSLFLLGAAVDVDLAFLGAPDNRLYCDLQSVGLATTDANGLARLDSPIPVDPTLLGSTISVQSATYDPAANAFGFVASNAIDVFMND